jgi:signal transduction histidine kinase
LWIVTLAASVALARQVMRRRGLPARLFLGMVASLAVFQIHVSAWLLSFLLIQLWPGLAGTDLPQRIWALWPLDVSAAVLFACLTLHLFLVFPVLSRLLRCWPWSPLLFYVPGGILAILALTPIWAPPGTTTAPFLRASWPQIFFIAVALGLAVARLLIIYFSRASARVRRQLNWLLWGLGLGGGLLVVFDCMPVMLGWPSLATTVPGLRQLPILIVLASFAVALHRPQFLSALADRWGLFTNNARLYGEMEKRATELTMLATVSSAISSSLDLEYVLRTIVESVIEVVNCDKSAIFELSEDRKCLRLRMSKGLSRRYIEEAREIPVDASSRAQAVKIHEPLIVPDIRDDERLAHLVELSREEGYRAIVDMPLIGRQGILGILSVYFDQVHHPVASELEVLTTFATQAAIAIENARLYATAMQERDRARHLYQRTNAALARRVEELTAIEQISRQLTATLDLQQVMDLLLERALQATGAHRGVISLYEADKHNVRLLAQEGYPAWLERYRTERWPDDRGITGRVARTRMPALVSDVTQDPDYVEGAPTSRSQATVPVVHKGEVIGIITVESDRLAAFTAEHLRFVELLADHAAIGINNATLFQQVMEGRDRMEAVLNSTRDAVLFFDHDGHLALANRRVHELLGPDIEAWFRSVDVVAEARDPRSQIYKWTELDVNEVQKAITHRDRGDGLLEIDFHLQANDTRYYLEAASSPVVGGGGKALGWVVVLRNMTIQEELEQFREDLTSMVIHNLQGPLTAVIGSLETLQDFDDISDEMADDLLRIALESSRKLYGRIESLLWLRRLEDSAMPLDLQPIPLPGVICTVMEEYLPTSKRAGIAMHTQIEDDLPPVVVDEEVIGRVFGNLLDNALKYTPGNGRIEVRAHRVNSQDKPHVLCAVADTGPGIPPQVQNAIFGKFRRGEQEWHGRRKGMGIGLHYCTLAVEAHGGRIWVESEEGKGSTFYFTLPLEAR